MPEETDLLKLAERAADIIYRYRLVPTRGFEYVSAAATRVTGYTPEEHYANPDLGFELVHPDDRALLAELTQAGPTAAAIVLRWRRKDGETIWTEQRNTPVFDDEGRMVAIEGIARQIADPTRAPGETVRLVGGVRVDLLEQKVYADGKRVVLTPTEFRLLAFLTAHADEVCSRGQIMRHLWRSEHTGSGHACETYIWSLRRKLERDARFPERILTVRGRGYTFAAGD